MWPQTRSSKIWAHVFFSMRSAITTKIWVTAEEYRNLYPGFSPSILSAFFRISSQSSTLPVAGFGEPNSALKKRTMTDLGSTIASMVSSSWSAVAMLAASIIVMPSQLEPLN